VDRSRWHAFRALPVRGQAGEIVKWIGTADDVTDPVHGLDDDARIERQIAELRAMLEVVQGASTERFGYVARCLTRRVNEAVAAGDGLVSQRRRTERGGQPGLDGRRADTP
jgi:hypothetical protein